MTTIASKTVNRVVDHGATKIASDSGAGSPDVTMPDVAIGHDDKQSPRGEKRADSSSGSANKPQDTVIVERSPKGPDGLSHRPSDRGESSSRETTTPRETAGKNEGAAAQTGAQTAKPAASSGAQPMNLTKSATPAGTASQTQNAKTATTAQQTPAPAAAGTSQPGGPAIANAAAKIISLFSSNSEAAARAATTSAKVPAPAVPAGAGTGSAPAIPATAGRDQSSPIWRALMSMVTGQTAASAATAQRSPGSFAFTRGLTVTAATLAGSLQSMMRGAFGTSVVDTRIGRLPVQAHYVFHQGKPIFAGWSTGGDIRHDGDFRAPFPGMGNPFPWLDADSSAVSAVENDPETDLRRTPAEADAGRYLAELLMAQLRKGPMPADLSSELRNFNSFLSKNEDELFRGKISEDDWNELLDRFIAFTVGFVPAFDAAGMRSEKVVHAETASALGLKSVLYKKWIQQFGRNDIGSWICNEEAARTLEKCANLKERLVRALRLELALQASGRLGHSITESSTSRLEEVILQWRVVRVSMTKDLEEKVSKALAIVLESQSRQIVVAGRALALIFSHSACRSPRGSKDAIAPLWKDKDMTKLFHGLMESDGWAVTSHRSFRQHLSCEENALLNRLIAAANFESDLAAIRNLDTNDEEAFWQAIEDSGREEIFLDNAANRIVGAVFNNRRGS